MKTKIQMSLKSFIFGMIPVVFFAFILSFSFQSCQKEEAILVQEESTLKSATIPSYFSGIINAIEELELNKGISNSLLSKINNTIKSVEKGNSGAAVNQLKAFINEINVMIKRGTLTNEQGTDLIKKADNAILLLKASFKDMRDGNEYSIVLIGTQIWMAKNLAYLPSVSKPIVRSSNSPYYYVYDYSGTDVAAAKANPNYSTYGVLYNWSAAMISCPTGWDLPSDAEWTILENYLIVNGYNYDDSFTGNKIGKSLAATTNWTYSSNVGAVGNTDYPAYRNKSGFSGLPGGYLLDDDNSLFVYNGIRSRFWSSTEESSTTAWRRNLYHDVSSFVKGSNSKGGGVSVRCIKN